MFTLTVPSVSDCLSLGETVERLKASPLVDGVAEFGSRTISQASAASDYDLLILVKNIPARVFQMVTTIDRRLTDVVLVETETADALLASDQQPKAGSFEALFMQKMRAANILHDGSGRLRRVQQLVSSDGWTENNVTIQANSALYSAWFWQSFGLLHLERLAASQDATYSMAFNMMLTSCLSGTWRSYFDIRGLRWEGEKAAIRYWSEHDTRYRQAVETCIKRSERAERVAAYRILVEQTLEPVGSMFSKGETAVMVANLENNLAEVPNVLQYWSSLFGREL